MGETSYNQLEKKTKELTALFEISRLLNSSFDLKNNLFKALKILSDILDTQRATITLYDQDINTLQIAVAYGLTDEQIAKGKYRVGEGIVGRVFQTGEPMIVPNIGKEPLFLNKTGGTFTGR